jgi:hypothetical protein
MPGAWDLKSGSGFAYGFRLRALHFAVTSRRDTSP